MNSQERIELHMHSKCSGDATAYAGEIIKQLSDLGIPAVAITDTSGIYAYPEMEWVYKTGNYTTRPIYGMEMPVEDSDGSIYSVSILVRNQTGLQNLYSLMSDNDSTDDFPVYRLEDLLARRDGLLLGSGVENGRIYRMLAENAGAEALKAALSLYDYVEVVPFEKYTTANKRILVLSEALGILAVAVSDAHYMTPSDRIAYEILGHWRKQNVRDIKCFFLNTEEMLQAFSYLPEEKAREIVIENTHKIADMCETVTVSPRRSMYIHWENESEQLRALCYEEVGKNIK